MIIRTQQKIIASAILASFQSLSAHYLPALIASEVEVILSFIYLLWSLFQGWWGCHVVCLLVPLTGSEYTVSVFNKKNVLFTRPLQTEDIAAILKGSFLHLDDPTEITLKPFWP
jgi:hypothetical protein